MPSDERESGDRPDADDPRSGGSLEEVIENYLEELAEGGQPDQEAYLRAHPDLATALQGVFKTLDFVERTSRSIDGTRLEAGQELGGYRIVREVGRGGMGVVYEAVQISLDRCVALKVLPFGALLSGTAAERFAREAATAGRLHHTNIVPVHDVGEEQGVHYYAMQYIDGTSLSQQIKMLQSEGTPPCRDDFLQIARWGRQVADALAYAHGEGIIHRDIKPSNLLLDHRGNVWVTDFGLARAESHATITVTGDVIGSARYMSPEQASGGKRPIDKRTDIFSLGITLYELLTRTPAFDAGSREAVLNQVVTRRLPLIRKIEPVIPKDLETIVSRCLEKEPSLRYQTAGELAEDCRRFGEGEPIQARRTPLIVKAARFLNRHRIRAAGTLLIVILAMITMMLVGKYRRTQEQICLDKAFDAILLEQNTRSALEHLDEAASYGADSAAYHLCRGLIPLQSGKPLDSIPHLEEAFRMDPDNVEVCLALALAHNLATDFTNGRRYFDKVSDREIDTALGWLLHGNALSCLQGSAAIESYNRAIELKPDFIPAIVARTYYRANRLLNQGERSELAPLLEDTDVFVVCRPNRSGSYTFRARNYLYAAAYASTQPDMKEECDSWLADCRSDLETAFALRNRKDFFPYLIEGSYFWFIRDHRSAADSFQKMNALILDAAGFVDDTMRFRQVTALYALGDLNKALHEAGETDDPISGYYPMPLIRSFLMAEAGRLDEARAVCQANLDHYKGNATALFLFAAGMELLGRKDASRSAIEEFDRRDVTKIVFEDASQTVRGPAADYLAGRIEAPALLAAAEGHPGRRCEFAFYIGLRELGQGNREAGLAALETCVGTGVIIFGEYLLAGALIAHARANPEWPQWLDPADQSPGR